MGKKDELTKDVISRIARYVVGSLAAILLLVSLLSLFYRSTIWWIKILNFPRIQFWLTGIVLLVAVFFLFKNLRTWRWSFIAIIVVSLAIHSWYLQPYTFFSGKVVQTVSDTARGKHISILVANVYMHNHEVNPLLEMIDRLKPDLVLLMETDRWWQQHLGQLRNTYAHWVEHPLPNTYGMMFYSRYPLTNTDFLFLEHPNVPTLVTTLAVEGKAFRFFGVHPVPPLNSKKYPDNQGTDAGALKQLAAVVSNSKLPVMVAGDFNDVAWGDHVRLFRDESQLHDVREGRGFYNSFDAKSFLLRWPLDYVFVTNEFKLQKLERLSYFGSDHFPFYCSFVFGDASK